MIKSHVTTVYVTPRGDEFLTMEDAVADQISREVPGVSKASATAIVDNADKVRELLDFLRSSQLLEDAGQGYEAMLGAGDAGVAPGEGWRTWDGTDPGGPVVGPGALEVCYRARTKGRGELWHFRWDHSGGPGDIIAWRRPA